MLQDLKKALEIVERQAKVQNLTMQDIKERVLWYYDRETNKNASKDKPIYPTHKPAVDPQKSIKQNKVVCLECGKFYKILTPQHMAKHGLTHQEYKKKWGIDQNKPLISKQLSKRRSMRSRSRNKTRQKRATVS